MLKTRHITNSKVAWSCAVAALAACATYEQPAIIGSGASTIGADSAGGSSAGSATVTGGNTTNPLPVAPTAGTGVVAGAATGGSGGSGGAAVGGGGTAPGDGGEGGAPDAPDACPDCASLKQALVHRYDFEGTGVAVMDRVGTAHGSVQGGATLSTINGKGVVNLAGGVTGAYVDLPNRLLSTLTSATLEAWVTWGGGDPWQRIFDFGDSTDAVPEDNPANGQSYLFLTPMTDVNSGGGMRAVYSVSGGSVAAETRLEGTRAMPTLLAQVVVVVDTGAGQLRLFVDGASAGQQAFSGALSSINDVNAWLGRSQYNADPELSGTFHDFRVYNAALTAAQIATSFGLGPDPTFLAE
jgi:hypothetical protein